MTFPEFENRHGRENLCKRFLAGETTLAEERMLKEWFSVNAAKGDIEVDVARLLTSLPFPSVSRENFFLDEDVALFDEIVQWKKRPIRKKWRIISTTVVAAAFSLILMLLHEDKKEDSTVLLSSSDILESVQILSGLYSEEIDYMTAESAGQELIVTLQKQNNRVISYLVSKNQKDGTLRMIAINN